MKIVETLVYIFVVGTVTSDMAQPRVDIDLRPLAPYLADHLRRVAQTFFFNDASVRQDVIEKCEANGGSFAFDNATAALRDFQNSMDLLANETMRVAILNSYKPRNDQDGFAKFCGMIQTVNALAAVFLESVERCFTQEERQASTTITNITIATTNYICENNGSRLLAIWRDHGDDCFKNKSRAILSCTEIPRAVNRSSNNYAVYERIGIPWSLPTYDFDIEECRRMDSLFTCILQQFQTCKKPITFTFVSGYFNDLKEKTGCQNLLEAQTSAAVEAHEADSIESNDVKSNLTSNQDII